MSEAAKIETEAKKMSKSAAIRQAIAALGDEASASDVQAHAAKIAGTEIDIRAVYQIKSNMKTGRDTSIKDKKKAGRAASATPVAPKAKKVREHKPRAVKIGANHSMDYLEGIKSIYSMFETFGGKEQFIDFCQKLPVSA